MEDVTFAECEVAAALEEFHKRFGFIKRGISPWIGAIQIGTCDMRIEATETAALDGPQTGAAQ